MLTKDTRFILGFPWFNKGVIILRILRGIFSHQNGYTQDILSAYQVWISIPMIYQEFLIYSIVNPRLYSLYNINTVQAFIL